MESFGFQSHLLPSRVNLRNVSIFNVVIRISGTDVCANVGSQRHEAMVRLLVSSFFSSFTLKVYLQTITSVWGGRGQGGGGFAEDNKRTAGLPKKQVNKNTRL